MHINMHYCHAWISKIFVPKTNLSLLSTFHELVEAPLRSQTMESVVQVTTKDCLSVDTPHWSDQCCWLQCLVAPAQTLLSPESRAKQSMVPPSEEMQADN